MSWFDSLRKDGGKEPVQIGSKTVIEGDKIKTEIFIGDLESAEKAHAGLPDVIEKLMAWALNVPRPGGERGVREIGASIVLQMSNVTAESARGGPEFEAGDYEIEIRRIR